MAWALIGAGVLVLSGLLPWRDAAVAVGKGLDVYLFLAGMMLLSELARREGLFEFLAAHAVHLANGSPRRLFLLTYAIGTVVTVFMSNDATAVVLTPAVYAAARQARAPPLPYLFACAFIANAASFVLPISNPANLVIFGRQLPPLRAMARTVRIAIRRGDRRDVRHPPRAAAWRIARHDRDAGSPSRRCRAPARPRATGSSSSPSHCWWHRSRESRWVGRRWQ